MIVSEHQAEQVGEYVTSGNRPVAFTVFMYEHKPSKLTLFGVTLADGRIITADPRATTGDLRHD